MGYIRYNADHEEPDCMRCGNLTNNNDKFCFENCGAEHCWNGYYRKEYSNLFNGDLDFDEYMDLLTKYLIGKYKKD